VKVEVLMSTWWFQFKNANATATVHLAVEADNAEDADLEIQRYMEWHNLTAEAVEPKAAEEFPPCDECPHRDPCCESAWDDGIRIGGLKIRELKGYSTVHTCPTCNEKVFDLRTDPDENKRNIVPDDCPRWNATFGSAIDCDGCRGERDALRQAHPKYQERTEAAMGMMHSLLEQAKANKDLPEGVKSLDSKRVRDKSVKALSAALNPLGAMEGAMDDPARKKAVVEAAGLMTPLWEAVWETDEFKSEWYRAVDDGLDQAMQTMLALSWLDGLFLAIDRHPKNAKAMAHEWHLVFTDHAVAKKALHNMPDEKRRNLLAQWRQICEEFIA